MECSEWDEVERNGMELCVWKATFFLTEIGLTPLEALKKYKQAPLSMRRVIALLGVVHRTVLGEGPPQFRHWVRHAAITNHNYDIRLQEAKVKHRNQLHDYPDADQTSLLRRSPLGLPRVYNELEPEVVACPTVKSFQTKLQEQELKNVEQGKENGENCLEVKCVVK